MSKKENISGYTAEILIAEDSPTQAAQIQYLLESHQYKVTVTQNGLQALDWISGHKPSLVITDIIMPEMNGFELCEKIKFNERTEDIPVILLTSLSDPNEVIEGLSCGADGFITKPYNKENLISNIEKILIEKAGPKSKGEKLGIEVNYDGKKRQIHIEPQNLVKLLLNIYQGAIYKNNELSKTQDELRLLNESLEELVVQRTEKLIIANKELVFQNREKEKRADELIIANKELAFQNREKEKRAAELIVANKELAFQNGEKEKRAAELIVANKELVFQNREKEKRADELIIANKELAYQNEEKEKRAAELIIANKKLAYQNEEKEKRAAELIIANKELVFQNREKEKRADELIIANKELAFQNEEKEDRAKELVIANKELLYQNEEKEKRATELGKAREKAEESDNLKTAFLHNLSHEIRTPMNQIMGFASFLKDPDLPENQRDDYIDIINNQSNQLLHIISDIVEISEITTGQVGLKLGAFSLGKMMDELSDEFKHKTEPRNLQLRLNKKISDEDSLIQGDEGKLKQIISNLIDNAIKFTDTGSIDIEYSRAGERLIIAVKDTGIGIEEQEKQIIFDHFRQIEITMARKYGGMGLGLSISNAYIRMMSGVIRVESKPGEGSTFFVEIPYLPAIRLEESATNVLQSPVISRPEWKDKTLLIAEDEESNVQFLKAVLRSTEIQVLTAVNGLEAVEQCQTHPEIKVVLMDIKMPRMDGLEATKIIKSFRPDLSVIATTAFALASEREYILKAGCDDYLPKPITRGDLIEKIQKNIGN